MRACNILQPAKKSRNCAEVQSCLWWQMRYLQEYDGICLYSNATQRTALNAMFDFSIHLIHQPFVVESHAPRSKGSETHGAHGASAKTLYNKHRKKT